MKPNKEFLKNLISGLQKQLAQIEKEEKPTSVWALEYGDECWIISGKGVVMRYHAGYSLFEMRRSKGDVFLSEEDAHVELSMRRELAKGRASGLVL